MNNIQELYKNVYALLDQHPVAKINCGELCGKACCCYIDPSDTESGMEIFPGEEEVFPIEASWHQPRFLKSSMYNYPAAWGLNSGMFQIRCTEPCPRHERPINCRMAPFQMYCEDGRYYLAVIQGVLSYNCPLVEKLELLNPEFVESAREAGRLLLTIPRVKELVVWDSVSIDRANVKFKVEV